MLRLSPLFAVAIVVHCSSPCVSEIEKTVSSPDGAVKAVAFQHDCGATTGFATNVSVVAKSENIENGDEGNVFVCEPSGTVSREVDLAWTAPRTLRVSYKRGVRVFRKQGRVGDVAIEFVETQ